MSRCYAYIVQPGEDLITLVHRLYGWSPPARRYAEIVQTLKVLNPHVPRLESPVPGTTLVLCEDPANLIGAPPPPPPHFLSASPSPAERQQFWVLAWAQHSQWLTAGGGVALGAGSTLLGNGNLELLRQVGDEYAAYRQSGGRITKGQYDHRRRTLIERFRQNMGPAERWLFRGASTSQAIRIARGGGVPYDQQIRQHADRLSRLGSLAARGGLLLTGVGLASACVQIATASDNKEKNAIFVDTVTSTVVGGLTGIPITIFIASNPVGWGVALGLALGSAALSWKAGSWAREAYDSSGDPVDLVSGTGLNRVCRL
jgi:hypothetical protein